MNFGALELHTDRKVLPIGKWLSRIEDDGTLRYVLGFSYENGLKLHVIENYYECEHEHEYEETQREVTKSRLFNEFPSLTKVTIREKEYLSHSGQGSPMRYTDDISLFCEFMREGWSAPEELKYMDWEHLALYSYDIECGEIPEIDGKVGLVYKKEPKHLFVEWEIPLKIGEPYDCSLESCGKNIPCFINNVYLLDVFEEIEKTYSDPKAREKFSEKQLADMKRRAIEVTEEHCPRDMRYVVIEYECDENISFCFDLTERLDKKTEPTSGGSMSLFLVTHKTDKSAGEHGLPLKSSVLQTPVAQDITEIPVELFYISINEK